MQSSQQFQDPNLYMYTPSMVDERDNALFQVNQMLSSDIMIPLANTVSQADQVNNFKDHQSLSVDINPCISVTEPTPIYSYPLVDPLLNNVWPNANNYLSTDAATSTTGTGTDWLSWTPVNNNSPASIISTTFDESNSHSISPEPMYLPIDSTSVGYPSPSLSEHSVKNNTRPRRISEPPMPFQDQFQLEFYPPPPQGSQQTNKRRKRANSTHNHACPHPGCGKHFTRPYNLTSHMRTHTADRPFACSQCGRRFARQHDRNRHEKLHWGIKPYACMHCKKPFARMDALNRHLRVDNGCQQQIQKQIQKQLNQLKST